MTGPVWDSPGGVIIPAPDCVCGHPYVVHDINTKGDRRTRCTSGPINDVVVQCPCRKYVPQ